MKGLQIFPRKTLAFWAASLFHLIFLFLFRRVKPVWRRRRKRRWMKGSEEEMEIENEEMEAEERER